MTVFCLPLWLYALLRAPAPRAERALAPLALAAGIAGWLLPTLVTTGGVAPYLELSRALIVENVGRLSSPLFGASRAFVLANLLQCAAWSGALLSLGGLLALLLWPFVRRAAAPPRLPRALLALWLLPALLYFVLMYASKPGYFLFVAPPVLLLVARGLGAAIACLPTSRGPQATRLPLLLLLVLLAAVDLWLFLVPVPRLGRPSAMEVTYNDLLLASHLDGFRRLCSDGPDRCAALYHLPPIAWRAGCVYAPRIDAYQVQTAETQPNRPPGTSVCHCRAGQVRCAPPAIIPLDRELSPAAELWLDARVERLILLVDEHSRLYRQLAASAPIRQARGERGLTLRFLELPPRWSVLALEGLTLRREARGRDPYARSGLRHGRP